MNMAIDEALLETADVPTIRFYRWNHPALSFGYFGRFADVENYAPERDLVRRWTGGGIVFHGEDLTYSLVIPASESNFADSSVPIYESVHRALRAALVANGELAELATVAALYERRSQINSAVIDRRYSPEMCFANPVRADVLLSGQKIAGAAQRRTRRGLLQQGSIQHVDLPEEFEMRFATKLSVEVTIQELGGALLERAREIARQKYGTDAWLHRR
jgi:lipoate-protein ligase A